RVGAAAAVTGDELIQAGPVGFAQEPAELGPLQLVCPITEYALDRGALVRDDTVRVENRDQVAGVSDERPEAGLALPAVKILGEGRALDRQRDLEAQRLERPCYLDPHLDGRAHDQETAHLGLDGERDDQDRVAAVEPQVASSLLWQLGV